MPSPLPKRPTFGVGYRRNLNSAWSILSNNASTSPQPASWSYLEAFKSEPKLLSSHRKISPAAPLAQKAPERPRPPPNDWSEGEQTPKPQAPVHYSMLRASRPSGRLFGFGDAPAGIPKSSKSRTNIMEGVI